MSKRNTKPTKGNLALWLAGGGTVAAWARRSQTPERTARRWSRLPEVLHQVEEIRRKATDRAIGELTRGATAVARRMRHLAHKAESEAVQLAACRAVLADLATLTDQQQLARQLDELERRVDAQSIPQG